MIKGQDLCLGTNVPTLLILAANVVCVHAENTKLARVFS